MVHSAIVYASKTRLIDIVSCNQATGRATKLNCELTFTDNWNSIASKLDPTIKTLAWNAVSLMAFYFKASGPCRYVLATTFETILIP
jgi:hypothetical protein